MLQKPSLQSRLHTVNIYDKYRIFIILIRNFEEYHQYIENLEPGEINVIGESLVETQLHTSINDYLGAKHLFEEKISSKK